MNETNTNNTPATPEAAITTTDNNTPATLVIVVDTAPATSVVAAVAAAAVPAKPAEKKADTLVIPAGSFTHTDLARANGKTNQQVWTRYQTLVKSGTIIRDGTRPPSGGRGKPSLLWKLNPNGPNPVPTAPAPVVPAAAPATTPTIQAADDDNIVMPTEAQMEAAADATPAIEAAAQPAAAPEPPKDESPQGGTPVATDNTTTVIVEVARVEAPPALPETPAAEPPAETGQATPAEQIEETCPACQHNLTASADATGVLVGCDQPKAICPTAERVEGHGSTIKAAVNTLHDKWDKLIAAMKPATA